MKKSIAAFTALLFITFTYSYSHALWIETASTGKAGKSQEVKIYYGEYAENEREDTSKWFSDVEAFTLWLVDAKNTKTQLTTTAASNHFSASFIPAFDGVYTLLVQHGVKDFPGSTRYEFITSALVIIEKPEKQDNNHNDNNLSLLYPSSTIGKANKPYTVKALFKGQSSKEVKLEIVSPTGWSKKIKADENGNLTFTPLWPGTYFIEASHVEKQEGQHFGKDYKATWRGATAIIEIK